MQTDKPESIPLRQYLATDRGGQYLDLLKGEVEYQGGLPASKTGNRYPVLRDLLDILVNMKGDYYNIPLDRSILDAMPYDVLMGTLDWTYKDYATMILSQSFDESAAWEQVRYAFEKWTYRDGEPIVFADSKCGGY